MAHKREPQIKQLLQYGLDYFIIMHQNSSPPFICVFSPASAYIFGEHADYNQGYAMSLALPLVTMVLVGQNRHKMINIAHDLGVGKKLLKSYPVDIDIRQMKEEPVWAKITIAAVSMIKDNLKGGLNIAFVSWIPKEVGLGFHASSTTAICTAMECLTDKYYSAKEKINICKDILIVNANVPRGLGQIMVALFAQVGYALVMDCKTLTGIYLPVENLPVTFVIAYSGLRSVSIQKFKQRMGECRKVASMMGVKTLADADSYKIQALKGHVKEALIKRATHVLEEIVRVHSAIRAFKAKDYKTFGLLMLQSHASLKKNVGVSCKEIDELVSIAMACPGVYGSKLSGPGLGGCTISLVKRKYLPQFFEKMKANYKCGDCFLMEAKSWGCASDISVEMRAIFKENYLSYSEEESVMLDDVSCNISETSSSEN